MPRPRETSSVAAAIGGLGDAAVGTSAIPLEESLRRELARRGFRLDKMQRVSPVGIDVLCSDSNGRFWVLEIRAAAADNASPGQLDDRVYDAALVQIGRLPGANAAVGP